MVEIPLTRGLVALVDDEDAGLAKFTWCAQPHGRTVYAIRTLHRPRKRTIRLHRVVLGTSDGVEVDHVNGDGLDCRRSNLRVVSHTENAANLRLSRVNSSGFKGVWMHRATGQWRAMIRSRGQRISLGLFGSAALAAEAYDNAARRVFGPFAAVNFPRAGERGCRTPGVAR